MNKIYEAREGIRANDHPRERGEEEEEEEEEEENEEKLHDFYFFSQMDMQESPGRPIAQWHVLADPKLKMKK